jgi:hypothetical protein
VKFAFLFVAPLLACCPGCNAILGIDAAMLESADASAEATTTGPLACTLRHGTACNTCVAQNCCAEFEACNADKDCRQGLIDYAFCLGSNFTSDAGASCDETFNGVAGKLSSDLATCAIVDKCHASCDGQTIGDDLCTNYCMCMQTVCSDHPFEGGSCLDACSNFDATNLVCRPYHCNLARINMMDESKRVLHCGHASGNSPCHP